MQQGELEAKACYYKLFSLSKKIAMFYNKKGKKLSPI